MTPFQVIWSSNAVVQLADLWNKSQRRAEITKAQFRIDIALASDPHSAGRELSEGLWKIDDSPLLAFYEINDVHNIVGVTDVYTPIEPRLTKKESAGQISFP